MEKTNALLVWKEDSIRSQMDEIARSKTDGIAKTKTKSGKAPRLVS